MEIILIHLANTGSCPFCQRRWRVYCCAVRQNERQVLARSSNAAALALIRLTNVAKPLPYESGETKGELPLRGQSEQEALRIYLGSDEMKGSRRGHKE
ncbi:MAG TPA: hypothetical protein VFZ02_06170 [Ktedonobacteraceae bacterium]